MSVRKRTWINDSGTTGEAWVCRYRDAEGKQRLKTFEREREAKAWEAQMRVDLKQGTHRPERTSVTIRKAGALLLETCEAEDVDPATIEFYEKHLRVHIYPATASKTTPNAWEGQLLYRGPCQVSPNLLPSSFARRLMTLTGLLLLFEVGAEPPHDGMRRMGRFNLRGALAAGRRQGRPTLRTHPTRRPREDIFLPRQNPSSPCL
jgi:hypothetical protein